MLLICDAFDALLFEQAKMDVAAMQAATGTTLTAMELDELLTAQRASWRWTFLTSGMDHPMFEILVADLIPNGAERLRRGRQRFVGGGELAP